MKVEDVHGSITLEDSKLAQAFEALDFKHLAETLGNPIYPQLDELERVMRDFANAFSADVQSLVKVAYCLHTSKPKYKQFLHSKKLRVRNKYVRLDNGCVVRKYS